MIPQAKLPTKFGEAQIYGFQEGDKENCVIVFGDVQNKEKVLCRVHSSCVTGDVFSSLKCDCGEQLDASLEMISEETGVLIYLDQEGRDIGLSNKIQAYRLQDLGFDTVQANEELGLPIDNRNYTVVKTILDHLGISSIRLITNNPDKVSQIGDLGIDVVETVACIVPVNASSKSYLETKKNKMRHIL